MLILGLSFKSRYGKISPPEQKVVFKQSSSYKPPRKHMFESSRGLGEQLSLFPYLSPNLCWSGHLHLQMGYGPDHE